MRNVILLKDNMLGSILHIKRILQDLQQTLKSIENIPKQIAQRLMLLNKISTMVAIAQKIINANLNHVLIVDAKVASRVRAAPITATATRC